MSNTWVYVGTPVVAALLANTIIYGFRLNSRPEIMESSLLPPGYVIGSIWVALFGVLGYAYGMAKEPVTRFAIVLVLVFCLSYPFVTGLSAQKGRIMNTITLILASALLAVAEKQVMPYLVPLWLWAAYVNMTDAIACSSS